MKILNLAYSEKSEIKYKISKFPDGQQQLVIEEKGLILSDVTIRTTLIVGFPGETKEDFKELEDFVKETKFDKLGAFQYSKEEGTPAAKLPDQIHGNTKKARYNK